MMATHIRDRKWPSLKTFLLLGLFLFHCLAHIKCSDRGQACVEEGKEMDERPGPEGQGQMTLILTFPFARLEDVPIRGRTHRSCAAALGTRMALSFLHEEEKERGRPEDARKRSHDRPARRIIFSFFLESLHKRQRIAILKEEEKCAAGDRSLPTAVHLLFHLG